MTAYPPSDIMQRDSLTFSLAKCDYLAFSHTNDELLLMQKCGIALSRCCSSAGLLDVTLSVIAYNRTKPAQLTGMVCDE